MIQSTLLKTTVSISFDKNMQKNHLKLSGAAVTLRCSHGQSQQHEQVKLNE